MSAGPAGLPHGGPGGAGTATSRAGCSCRRKRAAQLALAREEAGGRDLEYTRWGSIDMSPERAEALAAEGVTRVVVNVSSADLSEQKDQMSALAERVGL